jgi:O-antigen ligase
MYVFTIPLLFLYIRLASLAIDFRPEVEKYISLLFVLFSLGTLGLVYLGAGYRGTDNLLATRNIADTNTTMAYFILLWPFTVFYTVRKQLAGVSKLILTSLFVIIVILSFSRGALLIVLPYIIITCFSQSSFLSIKWVIPISVVLYFFLPQLLEFVGQLDLVYFWTLRFADVNSFSAVLDNLEKLSGRSEIHETAHLLFREKPFLGHGIASFELLGPGYREAHSLWYTLLAEQGMAGAILHYSLLVALLLRLTQNTPSNSTLLLSVLFFLIFNHSVGSTFIILTGKSISINCIGPMLLIVTYFYSNRRMNYQNLTESTV